MKLDIMFYVPNAELTPLFWKYGKMICSMHIIFLSNTIE